MTTQISPQTAPRMENNQQLAQEAFDAKYITAGQIMKDLQVSRAALLYARRRGQLPTPICLNEGRLFIWERDKVQPYLDAWKIILKARKGA